MDRTQHDLPFLSHAHHSRLFAMFRSGHLQMPPLLAVPLFQSTAPHIQNTDRAEDSNCYTDEAKGLINPLEQPKEGKYNEVQNDRHSHHIPSTITIYPISCPHSNKFITYMGRYTGDISSICSKYSKRHGRIASMPCRDSQKPSSQHIHPQRIQDLVHGVDIKALLDAVLHNEVKFTCGRDAVARACEEISRIVEV